MHGIDYNETYSTEIDGITFQFLIAMAVTNKLDMQLMNVVTVHLYGLFENDMYTKIPRGYKMSDVSNRCHVYCIKVQRSLYDFKQSGHMWDNHLSDYLIKEKYLNDNICLRVFIKS